MTTVVPGVPPLRPPGVATRPRVGRRARSRAATAWRVASNPAARLGGGARGALAGGVRLFADSRSRTTSSPPLASTSRGFPTARASPRRETRTRAIGTETRAETECADGDENCVPPPGAVPLDATATDGVDAIAAEARETMTRKTNNVAFVDKLRVDDATAAAMKKRSEAYATLDDIVLDFDPSLDTAQKLLLIGGYFSSSPTEVATRLAEVTAVAARLYAVWTWEEKTNVPDGSRTRASTLRDGIAGLGPVFVKMAQTLSTRPDIIGDEAADALKPLQDQMKAFSSDDAYRNIRKEFNWDGPIAPGDKTWAGNPAARTLYKTLSAEPVAAASIGQVYKGTLWDEDADGWEKRATDTDGAAIDVAVKVQRPGVLRQIALDLHIARLALIWVEESGFNGSTGLANIVDRVGAGIFQELDYTVEARNAADFRRSLRFMDFLFVPRHYAKLTGRRVLTQEWIVGKPMKELSDDEQFRMVQMGVECSSAQLFRTGLVHADPHEGNMLYTPEGKLALLDFGLVCRVNNAQQEAMAGCILNILNRDWGDLIDNLRIIEMLPGTPQTWVSATGAEGDYTGGEGGWEDRDDETFREAFAKCMDGDDPEKDFTNFTELVMDLTKLSTAWRFQLPPYMVFIIRSLTTLDFCAVRTGANMYELAAPTALFRALAPKTKRGREQLRKTLIAADGRGIDWKKLIALTETAGGDANDVAAASSSGNSATATGTGTGTTGIEEEAARAVDEMERRAAKAAEKTANGAPTRGGFDEHTRESVSRLVTELVSSSSGSALRRIIVQASPESLVPPEALRSTIVKGARESFADAVAAASPRSVFETFVAFSKSLWRFLFDRANPAANGYEECEVFAEGSPDAFNCRVNLDKRRREIARLMIRSKLSAPRGALSAAFMMGLMAWAAVTGALVGMVRGIRRRLGGGGKKEDAPSAA